MENLVQNTNATNVAQEPVEKDTEETKLVDMQNQKEYSGFSPAVKRAIQQTIKLMSGKYGGGFYVKYLMDTGTCYGWLNLVIVYPDGSYKSVILYKNYLKETDTENSNGIYNPPKEKPPKGYYPHVSWDGNARLNCYTSLEQYERPDMAIPVRAIWRKIIENYHHIPIVKLNQSASIDQLVEELCSWAEEQANEMNQGFMCDGDRCYITPEDFREIVENNGWTVSQARTELDMQGIFEKDAGSKGYQKTKRVGTVIKRFYVIRKNAIAVDEVPKSLEDVTYNPIYKTKIENHIESLEAENKDMALKYNSLIEKYEPDSDFII